MVGGGPCSWVNTLMKYVFSSFTLSSSVSVIKPSFLFRWGSYVVFSLLVTYGFDAFCYMLSWFYSWPSHILGSLILHVCSCISTILVQSVWGMLKSHILRWWM